MRDDGQRVSLGSDGEEVRQVKVSPSSQERRGERREGQRKGERRQNRPASPKARERSREVKKMPAVNKLARTVQEVLEQEAEILEVVHAVPYQWVQGATPMRRMLKCLLDQEQEGRRVLFPLPVWYAAKVCRECREEVVSWVKLMVVVLNYMYLQATRPAMSEGVNEAQKECITSLKAAVETLVQETPKVRPLTLWLPA